METGLTRTFPQTTFKSALQLHTEGTRGGFSLIEMLVVVALIALVTTFALPSVTSYFQVSLTTATREIAGTVKETFNSTVVTGKVHRLVYDIRKSQYWVESGPANTLLDTQETREKEERRKKFASLSEQEKEPPSAFHLEKTVTRKKVSLPRGVTFEDIFTQQGTEPITDGTVYTHFFPHGVTEETVIHLTDQSKHRVSLVISPLIGQTDLYEKYVTAKEVFSK